MPSRPKFTAFANNRALGRERFAEQPSVNAGNKPHKRFRRASIGRVDRPPAGPGWLHALALFVGKKLSCFEAVRGLAADEALIDGEAGCEKAGEATSTRS